MNNKHGFTIVELLVVIAIIGILVALLLPAVQTAREAARRVQCKNKLKQIALALHNYHDSHNSFPAAGRGYGMCDGVPAGGEVKNSNGLVALLPYLEQQALYDQFNHDEAFSNHKIINSSGKTNLGTIVGDAGTNGNAALSEQELSIFICPSDNNGPKTHTLDGYWYGPAPGFVAAATNYDFITSGYEAWDLPCNSYRNSQNKRMFGEDSSTRFADVTDGLTNTFMVGETTKWHENGRAFAWAYRAHVMTGIDPHYSVTDAGINLWHMPWVSASWQNPPYHPRRGRIRTWWSTAGSLHSGGCHFAMGDGSVKFFSGNIDKALLNYLAQMSDGQVVGVPN